MNRPAAPTRRRPLRVPAVGLGCSYLLAIIMLGPLLGSSADSSTAFADHFADAGNRGRDVLGSLALIVAASMLVWTVVTARTETSRLDETSLRDLSALVATVTASVLVVAAALLLTVPLTTTIGDLTDDPGLDPVAGAAIAQAGTVALLVAALWLALTTVLLARIGRQSDAIPRWVTGAAWATAATLVLGVSVVLLVPFAAWAIATGLVWTAEPR